MKWMNNILANMILRSQITVTIPGLDMAVLTRAIHEKSETILRDIEAILYLDEITDREKLDTIANLLEQ